MTQQNNNKMNNYRSENKIKLSYYKGSLETHTKTTPNCGVSSSLKIDEEG